MDNEEFCNFVEYMMNPSKATQDPMLPLCKLFNKSIPLNLCIDLGGPTDIEDFLDFIEHPETHNDLQGKKKSFFFLLRNHKLYFIQLLIFLIILIQLIKIQRYQLQIMLFKLFNLIKQQ